jgi:hypothetical protein
MSWLPVDRRCAWLPCVCDAAAFLAQEASVVGDVDLECQLLAWVAAGVVDPVAPDERAHRAPGPAKSCAAGR